MVLAAIALTNFLLIYSSTTSRNFCRTFRALLCKILVSAHFLQEFCGVPGYFCRKRYSAVQARCSSTGFTGCGKKRKTVILSAEFARRIPLGLLFSIGRDSSLRSARQTKHYFCNLFSRCLFDGRVFTQTRILRSFRVHRSIPKTKASPLA